MPPPSTEAQARASSAASAWIACMGDRPVSAYLPGLNARIEPRAPGSNAPLPYYLRIDGEPVSLTIGLNGPIDYPMTRAEIDARIVFIAGERLPLPGLRIDEWRFGGLPRSTHLEGRHDVLAVRPDGFDLEIVTQVFAIYGLDPRVHSLSDAPTPAYGYFSLDYPREVRLVLHLTVAGF